MLTFIDPAASRGHVRTVWSKRWNGHVAPLALMQAHLFIVRQLARVNARLAESARLAEFASGYLVNEPQVVPDDLAEGSQYEPEPFSESRAQHSPAWHSEFRTGHVVGIDVEALLSAGFVLADVEAWSIDAAEFMPAGACVGLDAGKILRFAAPLLCSRWVSWR